VPEYTGAQGRGSNHRHADFQSGDLRPQVVPYRNTANPKILENLRILQLRQHSLPRRSSASNHQAGQVEYYDRRLPSFGLRLSYHGSKSGFVMTRLDGKLIRVTS
jgi:hypothetical protein